MRTNFQVGSPCCIGCGSPKIDFRWNLRNKFRLAVCSNCNLRFALPRPSIECLKDHYNGNITSRFYKHSDKKAVNDSHKIYKVIKEFYPNAKRVLEIGCSTGYYLYGLKIRGFDVVGSELSDEASRLAKKWYGISAYNDEFPPESLKGCFDVVIIHHVIEHVLDPRSFLNRANSYLAENGIMILETPNINSIGIWLLKQHYPVLCPPGHLNFFSISSLIEMLPPDHIVVHADTATGASTIYNVIIGLCSLFLIKNFLRSIVSKKIKSKESCDEKSKGNTKFVYARWLLIFSKVIHFLLFPLFYLLDFFQKGENVRIVSRKFVEIEREM